MLVVGRKVIGKQKSAPVIHVRMINRVAHRDLLGNTADSTSQGEVNLGPSVWIAERKFADRVIYLLALGQGLFAVAVDAEIPRTMLFLRLQVAIGRVVLVSGSG